MSLTGRMDSDVHGASNNMGACIIVILTTPKGSIIEQSFILDFSASNNEAEYEIVLAGLRMTITLGVKGLEVVNQVSGEYIARDTLMAEHL